MRLLVIMGICNLGSQCVQLNIYLNWRMSIVHELVLLGSLGPRLGPSLGPSLGALVRWSATFPIKSSPPCCGAPGSGWSQAKQPSRDMLGLGLGMRQVTSYKSCCWPWFSHLRRFSFQFTSTSHRTICPLYQLEAKIIIWFRFYS